MNSASEKRKSLNALALKKDEQVRQTVREQVYLRLGTRPESCPADVVAFINQAVIGMVKSGQFSTGDVQRVAQLARPMMPDAGCKSPQPPLKSPKRARPNTMPSPGPQTPTGPAVERMPHPPTASSAEHRVTVEEKYSKAVRERDWAQHVDEELRRYEEEQQALRGKRRETQQAQSASLHHQIEEAAVKKRQEVDSRRRDMQELLEKARVREEEERHKEALVKERSKKKRQEMEEEMRERIREREELLRQQRQEDRQYLQEIIMAEEEKKAIERKRKKLGREELLMFLSGNLENEKIRKQLSVRAIEQERREIELRDQLLAKKEAEADAERLRKDARSQQQMERARKIQNEYDLKHEESLRQERLMDERDAAIRRAKTESERREELDRMNRKAELKVTLINNLDTQIAEKKRREEAQAAADAAHRKQVEQALLLGDASDRLLRQKMHDQKVQQMKFLEAQMREKHQRTQRELQVKI